MPTTKSLLSVLLLSALVIFAACGDDDSGTDGGAEETSSDSECFEEPFETEDGLTIEDLECGDGEVAEAGMVATVHYVGTLDDGTQFDASRDRGEPFSFPLGAGQVIKGWDLGVEGMKVGGLRKLTIPPELGYGEAGAGGAIPPNATLVFEVELLEVSEGAPSS